MKQIYVGIIGEIFGYGLMILGHSEEQCRDGLRKEVDEWRNNMGEESSQQIFDKAFEDWGGSIKQVEIGKIYYDGFAE